MMVLSWHRMTFLLIILSIYRFVGTILFVHILSVMSDSLSFCCWKPVSMWPCEGSPAVKPAGLRCNPGPTACVYLL